MTESPLGVAVVGAGLSGLVAARVLRDAGRFVAGDRGEIPPIGSAALVEVAGLQLLIERRRRPGAGRPALGGGGETGWDEPTWMTSSAARSRTTSPAARSSSRPASPSGSGTPCASAGP